MCACRVPKDAAAGCLEQLERAGYSNAAIIGEVMEMEHNSEERLGSIDVL
jgi:hydrogenase maturation factor